MAYTVTAEYVCDRCGKKAPVDAGPAQAEFDVGSRRARPAYPDGWGSLVTVEWTGGPDIGTRPIAPEEKDLCDECLGGLGTWLAGDLPG